MAYYLGTGVPEDLEKGCKWWREAAAQGSVLAKTRLEELPKQAALRALLELSTQSNPYGIIVTRSLFSPTNLTEPQTNQEKSKFDKLLERANAGDKEAQFELGWTYAKGEEVHKDLKAAAEWFQKAAEQGNASAQANLGLAYVKGDGVTKDNKKAGEWWQKAAEQGHAVAQFYLGFAYKNGEGVARDHKFAALWYQKAADQGYVEAQYWFGHAYEKGKWIEEDLKKACEWYQKAAEQGYERAKTRLRVLTNRGVVEAKARIAPPHTPAPRLFATTRTLFFYPVEPLCHCHMPIQA